MTTLAYQGTASSIEKLDEIIAIVKSYSDANSWNIKNNETNSIVVIPHPKCEPLSFTFDDKLKFSGVVKTVYAPIETHHQIVTLFFELKLVKSLFKKLIIDDETGYWDSYVEEKQQKRVREIVSFPEVLEEQVIRQPLNLPKNAAQADKDFWYEDYDNRHPYFENRLLLHYPTIRNRMGFDLSNCTGYAFIADDIVKHLNKHGFFSYDSEFFYTFRYHYIRSLAFLWAWHHSAGKPTKAKYNKCHDFAKALENGFEGGETDGFISKNHREASFALDILLENEGPASPNRSLQIFYALFEFCGLQKLSE